MSAMYTNGSDNLVPAKSSDGTAPVIAPNPRDGYTLPAGTYYVELSSSEGSLAESWLAAFCFSFSAALAATFTLESTCYPATPTGTGVGPADVKNWDPATNRWFPESLLAASVLSAGGAGNAYAAPTYTAGGTNLGGFLAYIVNAAARRYRLKVVVTVQGTLRLGACPKGT